MARTAQLIVHLELDDDLDVEVVTDPDRDEVESLLHHASAYIYAGVGELDGVRVTYVDLIGVTSPG